MSVRPVDVRQLPPVSSGGSGGGVPPPPQSGGPPSGPAGGSHQAVAAAAAAAALYGRINPRQPVGSGYLPPAGDPKQIRGSSSSVPSTSVSVNYSRTSTSPSVNRSGNAGYPGLVPGFPTANATHRPGNNDLPASVRYVQYSPSAVTGSVRPPPTSYDTATVYIRSQGGDRIEVPVTVAAAAAAVQQQQQQHHHHHHQQHSDNRNTPHGAPPRMTLRPSYQNPQALYHCISNAPNLTQNSVSELFSVITTTTTTTTTTTALTTPLVAAYQEILYAQGLQRQINAVKKFSGDGEWPSKRTPSPPISTSFSSNVHQTWSLSGVGRPTKDTTTRLLSNESYMRDVQAAAVAVAAAAAQQQHHGSQPPPPSSLPAGLHLPLHAQSSSSIAGHGLEIPPKRPRMDLGHPHAPNNSSSLSTPLRIDTREANKESGYHPQVEAISPTGPEASAERDELRSTKDDLLQKITKVDREIAKAESQIAKLKKKQQELEDTANKPSSDFNEDDEKPKNQSVAQIIYAENRKKAREAHSMLDKLSPRNELPLYNQPSDTALYHENKKSHAHFKKQLVEYFKKRNEERENRERHLTETYSKLTTIWLKKVEKMENSKKRREREQRSRDLYEKIFPELRKQREDKERDHRLGTRGAVRSEADIENVIERLQEQELENKKMHSYAVIPPLLLPLEERRRKFINNNGLILDPLKEYEERKFLNTWTEEEKQTFKERFLQHPKNFGQIAQSLDRKTVGDSVQYYYLSKKTENFKQIIRKNRTGNRRRKVQTAQPEVIAPNVPGVVTRHRNRNDLQQEKMEPNENNDLSNRSTPVLKTENIKAEDFNEDESDKKVKKGSTYTNDTSEDEDSTQIRSGPPHPCAVCKTVVEQSRAIHSKNYALQLGLREEDVDSDSRVCNTCHCKALRKRHGHCPIPTCTSTKGRGFKVKNRFRHLPSKWAELSDEIKGPIIAEMQIPEGITKCCSGCVTRLTRKISQLTASATSGNTSLANSAENNSKKTDDVQWSDEDAEQMKSNLREHGRNWAVIADKFRDKTPEQCKKFFYNNRKKYNLDKIVLEYKRANQSGDQPPTLSTDEESGSSTSSCDEDGAYNNIDTPSSTSSSATTTTAPTASFSSSSSVVTTTVSNAQKVEDLLNEPVRKEAKPQPPAENHIKVESVDLQQPSLPPPSAVAQTKLKEEDYDSSATMSADEVEASTPRSMYPGQGYMVSSSANRDLNRSYSGRPFQSVNHHRNSSPSVPPPSSSASDVSNGSSREIMTVRDLMSNVIERQLSRNQQQQQHSSSHGGVANPTIHTLLEHSGPAPHKTNYIRDKIGLNPLQKTSLPPTTNTSMAPPPPPPSNDCETLDLSMPRRREPSPINNNGNSSTSSLQYREPVVVHRSSSAYNAADGNRAPPPPAHSGSKAITVPDHFRDLGPGSRPPTSGYPSPAEGSSRPLSSPHLLNRASPRAPPPTGGPNVPQVVNLRFGLRQPTPSLMNNKPTPLPKPQAAIKVEKPLTIQTGSITQGIPVNHSSRGGYEPLLRVTPPDKPPIGGSITHGTPVYDKKDARLYDRKNMEFYGGRSTTISPGGGGSSRYPSQGSSSASVVINNEPQTQMSSRAVIMNDFAMARSTEMQRRPDSREPRPHSPQRFPNRELSPRSRSLVDPRIMTDPRATIVTSGDRQPRDGRSTDPRYDIHHRVIPDARGDPKAEIAALSRGPGEIRGDPRAGLEPSRGASSVVDYRNDGSHGRRHEGSSSRSGIDHRTLERNRVLSAAVSGGYPPGYPMYITADGKYVSAHPRSARSPPRSTPPPSSSATSSQQRALPRGGIVGGITSGKPIVTPREVDYYRGHPEVTISKTTGSPRMGIATVYNDQNPLNSLVDVAVKQPKLPDPKLLEHKDHSGKSSAAAAVAALHQQQTRMVALAASAAASVAAQQQQQQKFVDRYLPPGANSKQIEAAFAAVAAASTDFSKPPLVQHVEQERQKQQNIYKSLIQNEYPPVASGSKPNSSSLHVQSSSASGMTPGKIIDAIIHHNQDLAQQQQIVGKYRRSPGEGVDLESKASPHKVPSRSPSVKSDNNPNGPEDGSSRPGSRSGGEISVSRSQEHDAYMKKSMEALDADYHWRTQRSRQVEQQRQTPPSRGNLTTAGMIVPPVVSDERQITRVVQPQPSPRPEKPPSRPGVEPISPPIVSEHQQQLNNMSRYMDPRRRLQAHESGKSSPGIFSMEYVNNKIVEEMKKNDSSPGSSSMAAPPPPGPPHSSNPAPKNSNKRLHDEENDASGSPRKRVREDNELPDSPGSGEMVIDESARPDSVSSHKTTSPAPSGNRLHPSSNEPSLPRYEPLSDDE